MVVEKLSPCMRWRHRGSEGIPSLILSLSTRWRSVDIFRLLQL